MKQQQLGLGKRALCCVTAVALASTMVALPATAFAATPAAKDVTGYVTASVTPASQSATEILGITNVDELALDPATVNINIDNENARKNYLKYILMGTDEWNKNPNPFYFNTVYKIDGSDQVVNNKDKRRSTGSAKDGSFMPNRALAPYGTGDTTDDKVWDQRPDLIIGVGTQSGTVNYDSGSVESGKADSYARAVENAKSLEANSYHPKGIDYDVETLATIVDKVYDIAKAADDTVKSSNREKKLRYGDATPIAKDYEKYVKGIQGYILKSLDVKKAAKKTVVVLTAITPDLVTLKQTPESWSASGGNRFLEITTLVANNYADGLKTTDTAAKTAQMSMTDLKSAVNSGKIDLVIVNDGLIDEVGYLDGLQSKTYWVDTEDGQNSTGAIYKVNANAPEIATNYGRILGCLYPEYVDQSDLVAYYYDKFYHIKDGKLKEAIDKCMDGVRNWDVQSGSGNSYVQWSESAVANYNAANVQNILNEGASYAKDLAAKNATAYALIKPTANLGASDMAFTSTVKPNDMAQASVTVASKVYYTGKALTPAVTVKAGSKTLVNGTDYTVAYKNNKNIGTATVTVTGKGAYAGTVSKNFTVTVKKNAKYSVGALKYQITNAATNGKGTVKVYGAVKKASKLSGKVTIPTTVKIGGKSFKVTEVGAKAFKGYKKVTSLTVGNNVKTIGTSAFQGCTKLKTVTLGKAVTTIKTKAFYGDKSLKTMKVASKKLKSVGKSAIKGINKSAKIKAPSSKVKSYKKVFKKSTGFTSKMRVTK